MTTNQENKSTINFSGDLLLPALVHKKIFSIKQMEELSQSAKKNNQTLFQYIHQYKIISEKIIAESCATYYQLPQAQNQASLFLDKNLTHLVSSPHLALPLMLMNNPVKILGICDPNSLIHTKSFSAINKIQATITIIDYENFSRLYKQYLAYTYYNSDTFKQNNAHEFLCAILSDATHRGASDCHIEPDENHARIRFRINGMLSYMTKISYEKYLSLVSSLKLKANCDIGIRNTPQDGQFHFKTPMGFVKSCRLSTCPTTQGEKCVIRLLDCYQTIHSLKNIGLSDDHYKIVINCIQKPQGLILITGPTGSGKSMTLYSMLSHLNNTTNNIITVEDPVEININGINQTQVAPKKGLNFQGLLRALLRQDPDIMMIGEIRDKETAQIAFHAAQTGHLVLATLHTNSAIESITRLNDLGVSRYQISQITTLIIAQRLIRTTCKICDAKPINCTHCTDGFSGRTGIFELLQFNENIRSEVLESSSYRNLFKKNKIKTLHEDGLIKIQSGITTIKEVIKVAPPNE